MARTANRIVAQDGKEGGRYPIAVLAKAFDLLDLLEAQGGLTLTELHLVEESLTKSLIALFHARIKYPDADEEPKAA